MNLVHYESDPLVEAGDSPVSSLDPSVEDLDEVRMCIDCWIHFCAIL